MGFALFEASGIFDPSAYGLNVGDIVNVIAVGGGGGGAGLTGTNTAVTSTNTEAGGTGGTSSFGSLLTALGGSGAPLFGGTQGTQGQLLGGIGYANYTTANAFGYYGMGGYGAGGFYPGSLAVQHRLSPNDARADCFAGIYQIPSGTGSNLSSSTDGYVAGIGAKAGKAYENNASLPVAGGPGGAGYGAGGGGAAKIYSTSYVPWASYGGNSGQVKQLSYSLASLSTVAVTIGTGGAGGGASLTTNGLTYGGSGANGCVMIFW